MADVKMPESVPCEFDAKGWAPCKKPSTNSLCSKHEKLKCSSCGEQALRSCDAGMGGLACGAPLCATCQHSMEGGGVHVTKVVYDVQVKEKLELRKTGKESKRMLELRGVRTDVELPRHLEELLKNAPEGFFLKVCHFLRIKHDLMGTFPAILKDTKIMVVTADKDSIIRIWKSLEPRRSEIVVEVFMVNEKLGVAYVMASDKFDQIQSRPLKLFSREEIEGSFTNDLQPFEWAPGLIGAEISKQQFTSLIQRELVA
jgi:hypothetical protein